MKPYKLYIFDADGTLRCCNVSNQVCPNKYDEWELMPGVQKKLPKLIADGSILAIASNQAGVAYGYLSEKDAKGMLCDLHAAATGFSHFADWQIQLCTHAVDAGCECRKPQPGMLVRIIEAVRELDPTILLTDMCFIGDQETDRDAAWRAGITFIWAEDFFEWK